MQENQEGNFPLVQTRRCNQCCKDFPATTEYFYASHLKDGRAQCKTCHALKSHHRVSILRQNLVSTATLITQEELHLYRTVSEISRVLGKSANPILRDIDEQKIPVFKCIYNGVGPSLALRREDAQDYIASQQRKLNIQGTSAPTDAPIDAPTDAPSKNPDQCGACGSTRGNIVGDINESTKEHYGYLCTRCHRLLRESNEDLKRLKQVTLYIEHTRGNNVC